jgi:hypothetical protein
VIGIDERLTTANWEQAIRRELALSLGVGMRFRELAWEISQVSFGFTMPSLSAALACAR